MLKPVVMKFRTIFKSSLSNHLPRVIVPLFKCIQSAPNKTSDNKHDMLIAQFAVSEVKFSLASPLIAPKKWPRPRIIAASNGISGIKITSASMLGIHQLGLLD